MRTTKTLIRLRGCAGWFESSLGANVRWYVFGLLGSFFDYSYALKLYSLGRAFN